jgi:hypothetical protein
VVGDLFVSDLFYVRPNSWLGGAVPEGGRARVAWVVPFRTDADHEEDSHLLFVDAENGHIIGGLRAARTP